MSYSDFLHNQFDGNQLFAELANSPVNLFATDRSGYVIYSNKRNALTAGYRDVHSFIGRNIADFSCPDTHKRITLNNDKVMHQNETCITHEYGTSEGGIVNTLSIKAPLLNSTNSVVGIKGAAICLDNITINDLLYKTLNIAKAMSLPITTPCLIRLVTTIANGKARRDKNLNNDKQYIYHDIHFTRREAQCIHYLLNNYTAGQIAAALSISTKTAEFHTSNIKKKLNIYKKSDLIKHANNLGFIELLFLNPDVI